MNAFAPGFLWRNEPLLEMEKYSKLDEEMREALVVESIVFVAADHFSVDELHKGRQLSLRKQAMRNVVVPHKLDQVASRNLLLNQPIIGCLLPHVCLGCVLIKKMLEEQQ